MRILFITNWAMAGALLERICRIGHDVCAVVTHGDVPQTLPWRELAKQFSTSPDAWPWSFGYKRTTALESVIEKRGLHHIRTRNLNDGAVVERLRRRGPESVLVFGWPRILGPEVLSLTPLPPVNCHPSLLPAHRGENPFHSVLRKGERGSGITFHHMTADVDGGEILLQSSFPVSVDDNGLTLQRKVQGAALATIERLLDGLEKGSLKPTAQNSRKATFHPRLSAEKRFITWECTAEEIHNHVRSLYPWMRSCTYHEGRMICFARSRLTNGASTLGEGGVVTGKHFSWLKVATRDGAAVLLGDVRVEGAGIKGAFHYLHRRIKVGDRLTTTG